MTPVASTPARPVESAIQGLSGPISVIEGAEATALIATFRLVAHSREHRGADPDVDRAIAKLRLCSAAYRARAGSGTFDAEPPEPVRLSDRQLTTGEASHLLGITDRAVRKAITEGRLHAKRSGGRWLIKSEDAARYRARV